MVKRSLELMVDKAFRDKSAAEILDAPPSALKGVSETDALRLEEAFGIRSVRDLAESRFFHQALAVLAAAGEPGYDPGPPLAWERFFAGAPLDHYLAHPSGRFRLDFGPVFYRGRLNGTARVIVVGQDPSTNEILAHRIFVGLSGQRIQGLLRKIGITRSYAMLNTFLFSVFGQFDAELRAISLEEPIVSFRNAFLDRLIRENPIQAIIAVGSAARHALQQWPGGGAIPIFEVLHPAADESAVLASWNDALAGLRATVEPDDGAAPDPTLYGTTFSPEDEPPIPREDLPFGLPDWHRQGAHSTRDGNKRIVWIAP